MMRIHFSEMSNKSLSVDYDQKAIIRESRCLWDNKRKLCLDDDGIYQIITLKSYFSDSNDFLTELFYTSRSLYFYRIKCGQWH